MAIKFGTSGWRAVFGEEFTFPNLHRLVHVVCDHVKEHTEFGFRSPDYVKTWEPKAPPIVPSVVVGYDTRFQSEEFARETAEILSGAGIKVLFSKGDIPTPVVAWAVLQTKAVGGITITASHNPPEYNGFKWTPFWGGPAMPAVTDDLERRLGLLVHPAIKMMPMPKALSEKWVELVDFKSGYCKQIASLLDTPLLKRSGLKVGVDSMYGAGRNYLGSLLEGLGIETVGLHEGRDVLFGGSAPDPSPERLTQLRELVLKHRLSLGLACDGDADRFGVLDADGSWISPNEVLALLLDHLVRNRKRKGKVVRSIMTSHFVDAVAKSHGLEVREVPVGFKYIGELLRTGQYVLGGEESGGLSIRDHVSEKDGILACLLLAELVAAEKKPLSKIRDQLFKKVGAYFNVRINLAVDGTRHIREVEERLKFKPPLDLAGSSVWRIDQTDGFKFLLKDGRWLGLRISGTESVVRLYAEAPDPKKLQDLVEAGKKILKGKF